LSVTQVWISAGDVVLVSLREFQNDKCDVILKYTSEEVRMLKAEDEIPENIEANENNDDNIEFAEKQGGDDDSDSDEDSEESDSDEEIEVPKKLAEKDIDDI
jgi:translation initiation factor 1A